jgi:hypothetical protein
MGVVEDAKRRLLSLTSADHLRCQLGLSEASARNQIRIYKTWVSLQSRDIEAGGWSIQSGMSSIMRGLCFVGSMRSALGAILSNCFSIATDPCYLWADKMNRNRGTRRGISARKGK